MFLRMWYIIKDMTTFRGYYFIRNKKGYFQNSSLDEFDNGHIIDLHVCSLAISKSYIGGKLSTCIDIVRYKVQNGSLTTEVFNGTTL